MILEHSPLSFYSTRTHSPPTLHARPSSLPIRPVVFQPRDQLKTGCVIEQTRDWEAISGSVGPHGGLRLGCIDAIDGARVEPEVLQMRLCDLDVSSVQEPVHRGAFSPRRTLP